MRIDLLLSKLCLIKTRSIAKTACDKDLVFINGKEAKSSTMAKGGDIITFSLSGYRTIIKLLSIPSGNVSKKSAPEYYEILERIKLDSPE
jgi:ribosome-associated heat shock protein Hsp15